MWAVLLRASFLLAIRLRFASLRVIQAECFNWGVCSFEGASVRFTVFQDYDSHAAKRSRVSRALADAVGAVMGESAHSRSNPVEVCSMRAKS